MTDADLLRTACALAIRSLDDVSERHVGGRSSRAQLMAALGGPFPIAARNRLT
jgi:hypothetical protein